MTLQVPTRTFTASWDVILQKTKLSILHEVNIVLPMLRLVPVPVPLSSTTIAAGKLQQKQFPLKQLTRQPDPV
ncbi:hypothetical protein K435DRAFT_872014 [Dendrothele bispora CBS 962.96]|uniref:Uncharacterized protein n=1 Tax=Dendrothele bispora (strain CBS 962.96) TaxID=1314807 RepID=A0A4S8L2Q3_DENBC|nr:hypothetical protein K435DRAFT_872014 [Dendrothele bispora CBS 962.96]